MVCHILRSSIVGREAGLAFPLEPGGEIHQARVLSTKRSNIRRVADLVEELECAGDLCVLLLNGLYWNLGIADRAPNRAADRGGYLCRSKRISRDLDGFAEIVARVLERKCGERANVVGGDQPDRHIRLERDCERARRHTVPRTE